MHTSETCVGFIQVGSCLSWLLGTKLHLRTQVIQNAHKRTKKELLRN